MSGNVVTVQSKFTTRPQLATLCNDMNLRIAVEVGTDQGVYAREFMQLFAGDHLFCIDPYIHYEWKDVHDRSPDLLMATINLAPYSPRVRIIKDYSPDIIKRMPWWVSKHLGFVYIDGSHEYANVKTDIGMWWNALTDNGVLAGHDYDATHPGVIDAVSEHAEEVGRTVYIIEEPKGIASWYMYKKASRRER